MILEDNYSGEKLEITTEEELVKVLKTKVAERTDMSLGVDKDHYVQIIPGVEDGQFYVGYKDAKGYDAFITTELCSQEKAKQFFLDYFRGSPDWQKGFEWEGIATGPAWIPYVFLIFVACMLSLDAWTRGKTHHLWYIWGTIISVIVITVILVKKRRVCGAVLEFLNTIKKEKD